MNPTAYTAWEWIAWRWSVLTHYAVWGGYAR